MITWTPCSERQPPEPGRYLGAVDWDEGATAECWWDGGAWWNINIDPNNLVFDDDATWEIPITHWAETPTYSNQQQDATIEIQQLREQNAELIAALKDVLGWVPGRQAWHTEEPILAVERARAAIAKAEGKL